MSAERIAYVNLAVRLIENFDGEKDTLIQWWNDEKPNREKWRLSPAQWPGLDLNQSFRTKLRNYKHINTNT